jgi:hypothetical protein
MVLNYTTKYRENFTLPSSIIKSFYADKAIKNYKYLQTYSIRNLLTQVVSADVSSD